MVWHETFMHCVTLQYEQNEMLLRNNKEEQTMRVLFFVLMGLMLLSLVGMLSSNEKLSSLSCELHKSVLIALSVWSIIGFINWNKPTAMDVYQGKTTLEITYRDGIPIDSVVVFKNSKQ